ncbi:RraA family protein [Corynebacterium comes]|uniref:Putative 4-hydroxy-4-methyl-2-oxoglutarate aldolase n=1 Tax=Corynebacterium comes TaxID=2675218 RepID=A0A6B8VGT1_9CORY|nr:dimethylmenaquinone methyltransferase [Corynebacterium comes]QGU03363.1 4-hydroxy-4-methyl-2-oxoglutarate aldolase [Corynebacterium comes]
MTISNETRAHLQQAGTPNVANRLLRRGFRNVVMHGIAPLKQDQPKLIGEAFTLRFIPAREDLDSMKNYGLESNLHRRAIEECPPEKVLVIDAFDDTRASAMGDMMARRLAHRGAAGVVTNGGFRDAGGILETGLPCYHRQSAVPATPIHLHPIAIDEPVGVGGVAVYPGDVIFGDDDGVVVIPADVAAEVAAEAADDAAYEVFAAEKINQGSTLFEVFPATEASYREFNEQRNQ